MGPHGFVRWSADGADDLGARRHSDPEPRNPPTGRVRAVLAASIIGAVAACGGSTSPSPPVASGAPSTASVRPTAAPPAQAPTPTPQPEWQPYTAPGGAVVDAFGPDGTVYVVSMDNGKATSLVALDQSGTDRPGWPYPIADFQVWSIAVSPSGDVFLATGGNGGIGPGHFVVLGPDGQPKPGWTVPLEGVSLPSDKSLAVTTRFGPDGIAHIGVFSAGGTSPGDGRIYAFSADGAPLDGWPVEIRGGANLLVVAPDGSVYLPSFGDVFGVVGLGRDGKPLPGWPIVNATGPWLGPDGTVYVAQDQTILAFGRGGAPLARWHAPTSPGSPGLIAFAGDGSLIVAAYLRSAAGNSTWPYVAFDATGEPLTAWGPFARPKDTYAYPMYPAKIGRSVYLLLVSAADQSVTSIVALGDDGKPKPGWESGLSFDSMASAFAIGSDDTAYVSRGGAVYAYAPSGDAIAGWPYRPPAGYDDHASVQIAPDGTIYVSSVGSAGRRIVVVGADGQELGQ